MKSPYPVIARHYSLGVDMTSADETQPPESLTTAENVRFTKQGGCSTRLGSLKQSVLGTGTAVKCMKYLPEYDIQFAKSGTKIFHSNDGWATSYSIGLTLTAGETGVFHPFKKYMHYTNGTDGYYVVVPSTVASINVAGNTVNVRSGDGGNFAASGTIYIRGISVTYSGVTGDQLTGCTGLTNAMVVGDVVTQTLTPGTAIFKGTCLADLQGQVVLGGVTGGDDTTGRYSAPFADTHPEYAYDYQANGANFFTCPTAITCLCSGAEIMLIGMKQGIEYGYGFDIETGGLLKRNVTMIHGVPNAFCIAYVENNTFAIFTGRRVLLATKDAYGLHIIDDMQDPTQNFDYKIRTILQNADADQSGAFLHFEPARRELKLTVFVNGVSQMWVRNMDVGGWSLDTSKPFGCMCYSQKDHRTYAGSYADDTMYLEDEGYTDNGFTVRSRIVTPVYVLDQGRVTSDYLGFTFAGLLSGAGEGTVRIYVSGTLVLDQPFTADDLVSRGLMDLSTGYPFGGGEVAAYAVGGAGSPLAFHFTLPLEFLFVGERFQVEWEIEDEGTVFELRNSRLDGETSGVTEFTPI